MSTTEESSAARLNAGLVDVDATSIVDAGKRQALVTLAADMCDGKGNAYIDGNDLCHILGIRDPDCHFIENIKIAETSNSMGEPIALHFHHGPDKTSKLLNTSSRHFLASPTVAVAAHAIAPPGEHRGLETLHVHPTQEEMRDNDTRMKRSYKSVMRTIHWEDEGRQFQTAKGMGMEYDKRVEFLAPTVTAKTSDGRTRHLVPLDNETPFTKYFYRNKHKDTFHGGAYAQAELKTVMNNGRTCAIMADNHFKEGIEELSNNLHIETPFADGLGVTFTQTSGRPKRGAVGVTLEINRTPASEIFANPEGPLGHDVPYITTSAARKFFNVTGDKDIPEDVPAFEDELQKQMFATRIRNEETS